MSTCRTCIHWTVLGMPRWAFKLGMACCSMRNTQAVTLNHWAACQHHQPAPAAQMPARDQWLRRCGINPATTPRSGSFQQPSPAGHSQPDIALVHGVGKWWTVDSGRWTTEVDS